MVFYQKQYAIVVSRVHRATLHSNWYVYHLALVNSNAEMNVYPMITGLGKQESLRKILTLYKAIRRSYFIHRNIWALLNN